MYCRHCGNEIQPEQKFCGKCGAAQIASQVDEVKQQDGTQKDSNKLRGANGLSHDGLTKSRKTSVLAVAVSIFVVACCATAFIGVKLTEPDVGNSNGSHDDGAKIIAIDTSRIPIENEDDAKKAIIDLSSEFGFADARNQLGECRVDEVFGDTYYRFGQKYQGIPVYGRAMILDVNSTGDASVLSNGFASMDGATSDPVLDEADALDACREMVDEGSEPCLFGLIYYANDGKEPELCYRVSMSKDGFAGYYFISAVDGHLVYKENMLCDITGNGKDISNKKREFEISTDEMFDDYVLEDVGRKIRVYDAKQGSTSDIFSQIFLEGHGGSKYYLYPTSTDGDNAWYEVDGGQATIDMEPLNVYDWTITKSNGISDAVTGTKFGYSNHLVKSKDTTFKSTPAVTLMCNLATVHDFYTNVLKRNGFDGKGGEVEAVFNVKEDNAFGWAPVRTYANVIIGMPDDKTEYLELPVIGHEFTHAVQSSICNLGEKEAGALKEATSDIFGVLICDYADNGKMDGSSSWVLSTRNLADPEKSGRDESDGAGKEHPSRYEDQKYWGDTNAEYDGGYVHNNSTVISHAAYLMSAGNLAGEALTNEDIGRIHLAAFYLVSDPDCDFAHYSGYVVRKAADLLTEDKAKRVAAAYESVNIKPVMVVYINGNTNDVDSNALRDFHEDRYKSYLKKVKELEAIYGKAEKKQVGQAADGLTGGQYTQLEGVCLVRLIDFDNDGSEELLTVVKDSGYDALNPYPSEQPQYKAEIWSYENGKAVSKLVYWCEHGSFQWISIYEWVDRTMVGVRSYNARDNIETYALNRFSGNDFSAAFTQKKTGAYYSLYSEYFINEEKIGAVDASDGQGMDAADLETLAAYNSRIADYVKDAKVTIPLLRVVNYSDTVNAFDDLNAADLDVQNPDVVLQLTKETIIRLGGGNDNGSTGNIEDIAHEFMEAWYNDWAFENGEMVINHTPVAERCIPFIAEGTPLYDEFKDEGNFSAASGSRFARSAALSIASIETALDGNNVCRVDVSFYGTQNTITQEMFDQMKDRQSNWHTWTLTFDDKGKITEIENRAKVDSNGDVSQYESVLSTYREGLTSSEQPPYEVVNPEAWAARDFNKDRFAYALYDINNDGIEELLIGVEQSNPVPEEGLSAYYVLYDLFTIENGIPSRVLNDEMMGSLGYRAFCIPCENGFLATGGSGGATHHVREYWRVGDAANEMSLSARVVVDGDEYAFTYGDGKTETLIGNEGRSVYANHLITSYTPITQFVWHLL